MLVKASAPGSLMLLGEYAVLYGKYALVCAIDKRITVSLSPRDDKKIEIISSLGNLKTDLSKIKIAPPFQFVLASVKKYGAYFKTGCTLTIESEFSDQVGFASSAAVTVATIAALSTWLHFSLSEKELARAARGIVRKVQGLGSGADVAACVLGGIVAYRAQPFFMEKLTHLYPLTAIYSGSKTPTIEAVSRVKQFFANYPRLMKSILQNIDICAQLGIDAVRHQEWPQLGKLFNVQQGLMEALGVNTPVLSSLINELKTKSEILGAKISGSGLGDCVIGLGTASGPVYLDIKMTDRGVYCEKN